MWLFLCLLGALGSQVIGVKCAAAIIFFLRSIYPVSLYCSWQWSSKFGPSKGRLNHHTTYIAKSSNKGQWIQVDFGSVAKVTKIGTQGRYSQYYQYYQHYQHLQYRQWVSKYTVSYSVNGGYFENQLHKSSDGQVQKRRVSSQFYYR